MPLSKNTYYIDNAQILYPNFRGIESPMNRKGDRNFNIIIPTRAQADVLLADGYNVKTRKAQEATEDYDARDELLFLPIKLGFNGRTPPRIMMISCVTPDSCKRDPLSEGTVGLLDTATITNVDCKIGPYDWSKGGNSGRTAYAQSLFVTVELDKYDAKYESIPMSDQGPALPDDFDSENDSYND